MNSLDDPVLQASLATADNLRTVARSLSVAELSSLSLPEIDRVVDAVARVVPVGNVPAVILNGLVRLGERRPPVHILRRDIDLLFQATADFVDHAVYSTFFAGPAAVLWGYQNLLRLAGKDPEEAFPEGTWQFYIDYALRDDTARHTNETHGFDTILDYHRIRLTRADRITAWVMAAAQCLYQFSDLLENEWRERVYLKLLKEEIRGSDAAPSLKGLARDWEAQRPYKRGPEAQNLTYAQFRHSSFDRFLQTATRNLPAAVIQHWQERICQAEARELPAYQKQMSILAYLEPGPYGETRIPLPTDQLHIGLIDRDTYYLIPIFSGEGFTPVSVHTLREQIAAIINGSSPAAPVALTPLARVKRTALTGLRKGWSSKLKSEIDALRRAPIWINASPMHYAPPGENQDPQKTPLAVLRQRERGVGDHAFTIFDYGKTFVFDQSHIFFDGAWGSAFAEILTNEALSWAVLLSRMPAQPVKAALPAPQSFSFEKRDWGAIAKAPKASSEVSVESSGIQIRSVLSLRKLFKQRSDRIQLTVNDLLVLYRAIHAFTYQPDPVIVSDLHDLLRIGVTKPAAQAALDAIDPSRRSNPSIIIPVDASPVDPRQRLYPLNIEVPLAELGLLDFHTQTTEALTRYRSKLGDRTEEYASFDRCQREYLACLAGLGAVMAKAKEITLNGAGASVAAVKMLAYLPPSLQRMLEAVPGKFDLLNDLIKGREVFSNVGQVAPNSTLKRFITAKDDNEKKTLAWGVMTDAANTMRVSLRDFRPHVDLLEKSGQKGMAVRMTEDYLHAYVAGINRYIQDLHKITLTSRETKFVAQEYQDES